MPLWRMRSVFILGLLFCIYIDSVSGCLVNLEYKHNDFESQESLCPKQGAIHFDSYKFSCLGNLNSCQTGLTLQFGFNPKPINPSNDEWILVSNGGHLAFSEGVFMTRKWNDQFLIGIAKGEMEWKVHFRLLTNSWSEIVLNWSNEKGLTVYSDGSEVGIDKIGSTRMYISFEYDVNTQLVVGEWNADGQVHTTMSFDIANITIFDKIQIPEDSGGTPVVVPTDSYVLDFSVEDTTGNNDINVLETAIIKISLTPNYQHGYTITFGDGDFIETDMSEIAHRWHDSGVFDVVVTTQIGQIQKNVSKTIEVVKLIERIPPEYIGISQILTSEQGEVVVDIVVIDKELTECQVNFGDGFPQRATFDDTIENQTFSHIYSYPFGEHAVSVECTNVAGSLKASSNIYTQDLFPESQILPLGNSLDMIVRGDTLFLNSLKVTVNDQRVSFTTSANTITLAFETFAEATGYLVTVSTADGLPLKRVLLNAQQKLSEPLFTSDSLSVTPGVPQNYTVTFPPGDHFHTCVTYGMDGFNCWYFDRLTQACPINLTATYTDTGTYPNFVETANEVSYRRVEITAAVDVPIKNIHLKATPSLDLKEGISFAVDLNIGFDPPKNVEFYIDYGDGLEETISYTSSDKHTFEIFYHNHIYETWGIYNITVTASNSLGTSSAWIKVQLGQNIDYIDLETTTERDAIGEEMKIKIITPRGTDITYAIHLGYLTSITIPQIAFIPSRRLGNKEYFISSPNSQNSLNPVEVSNKMDALKYETSDKSTSLWLSENRSILHVSHIYPTVGYYTVSVRAYNVFNDANTTLCPQLIVGDPAGQMNPICENPQVTFNENNPTSITALRSENTSLVVNVAQSCDLNATFTWRATRFYEENGTSIERPFGNICFFKQKDKTLHFPPVSLEVGKYRLTVIVSPVGYELTYTSQSLLLNIQPSPPIAMLGTDPTKISYIYGDTVLDMSGSKDPDLSVGRNQYTGLEFDLFCCSVDKKSTIEEKALARLKQDSRSIDTGILFAGASNNTIRLYDSCKCFDKKVDVRFGDGSVRFPTEQFTARSLQFYFRLVVCKEGRCSTTSQEIHVRSSNDTSEYDQLGDLLTSGNTDAALELIGVLSSDLNSLDDVDSEDEEKAKQATEKRSFLITALSTVSGNLTSIDQVENTANALESVTRAKSQVTQESRKSASATMNNVAKGLGGSGKNQSLDKLSTVGKGIVGSLSNLLPDEEPQGSMYKDAMLNRRRRRSLEDEEVEEEETEEEIKCKIIEGIIGSENPAGCDPVYMKLIDFFYPKKMANFREVMDNDVDDILEIILPELEEQKRKDEDIKLNSDREVATAGMSAIDNVASLFLDKIDENGTASISSNKVSVSVQKLRTNSSGNATIDSGTGAYSIPSSLLPPDGSNVTVGTKVVKSAVNQFTFGEGSKDITGGVISLSLTDESGEDLVVKDTDAPFEIWMKSDDENPLELSYHTLVLSKNDPDINYYAVQIDSEDMSLHIEIRTVDEHDQFSVFIAYEDFPNKTHHDYYDIIPRDKHEALSNLTIPCEDEDSLIHTILPPKPITKRNGTYRVGVKLLEAKIEIGSKSSNHSYGIRIFTSGCRFWNVSTDAWETTGCEVGQCSTYKATQCLCNHLTSFGGNFAVPPNTIDFNTVWNKFANLHENAAVFATVISILILYILLLIWARYMDKKDIHKWGAIPLEDNLPSDTYHYQLSVHTGVKKSAGTDSRISFILSGDDNDTGVRCLFDGKRKHIGRGTIMNYVLSVESALGPLTFLRIWHDNTGKGKTKGWYLDQVEVIDLQNGERFFFLCDRWLAVEEDDGQVERILPVAGINDLVAFKHLFSSNVRKKLSNEHLWFSVFSRPTRSKFTRCQRISCCLSLLFLTMITNAMWFKTETNDGHVTALKVGPFSFTLQQVFISFASTMIVFPVSFLLITIFKKSRQKKNTVIQTNQKVSKSSQKYRWKSISKVPSTWQDVEKSKKDKFKESMRNIISFHNRKYESEAVAAAMEEEALQKYGKKKKKKPITFPHWTIYIGWLLVFLSVTASAFFTILYSMEWGAEKANDWLVTFIMSFFQSVVVVQPVKVFLMVAFVACILKKPEINEEEGLEDETNINHDEELLAKSPENITAIMLQRKMAAQELQPPDFEALQAARELRLKEIKMEVIIKEIMIYAFFVLVLFFISYQTRDSQSFAYANHLRNTFKDNSNNGISFHKINTAKDFWSWTESVLIPQMYPTEWLNGSSLKWWDKRCISDLESRRVGIGRLRQLRVKEDSCKIANGMSVKFRECRSAYNWVDDDTKTYHPKWEPIEKDDNYTETKTTLKKSPWDYQNSLELKNAPYSGNIAFYKGGGYVANFERTRARTEKLLKELQDLDWIDVRSRAVFVEFTIYNPNVNLFSSITLVIEFAETGSANRRSEFKVFRLFSYVGAFGTVVLLFEVVYCCFTLYFLIHAIKKLRKERMKYFKCFWSVLEFVLLAFSVTCIVMYAFKHVLASVAIGELHESGSADFVNFNSLALYDELFGYMVGIVVFMATIQFLKMLQFNRRMNMLGDTIRLATKDLKNFSVMFIVYFVAFCQFAYLLFGRTVGTYGNFATSVESMFAFCLGSFDFDQMQDSQRILGPIFFFLFVGIVYIGLMGIFVTIIYDSFATIKADVGLRSNEHEIVDFMWKRLKGLIKG